MQHLDEGTIHSWLDGALAPEESARVEGHVAECAECASAVAEARGFIAASSRILTKLDDVPSGVVPVARPVRRRSFAAWQAAAAVLVVAAGSLVVLRNQRNEATVAASVPVVTSDTAALAPAAATTAAESGVNQKVQPEGTATFQKPPAPPTLTKAAPVPLPAPPRDERRQDAAVGAATTSVAEAPQANVKSAPFATDAMAEPPLRMVREETVAGGKRTLYAVAAADTVILFEPTATEPPSVATNQAAVPSARRAVSPQAVSELSAKAPAIVADSAASIGRAAGAVAQSRSAKASGAASPAALPAQIPPVRTISWVDTTSGRRLTLSGRLPVDQLEEIKRRIERERATAAATVRKPPR